MKKAWPEVSGQRGEEEEEAGGCTASGQKMCSVAIVGCRDSHETMR